MNKLDMLKLLIPFVRGIEIYIKTKDGRLVNIDKGKYVMEQGKQFITLEPEEELSAEGGD